MPSEIVQRGRRVAGRAARAVGVRRTADERGAEARPAGVSLAGRRLLTQSALFDQAWVEHQLGRTFESREEAVDAYLARRGCSPHPLFFADYLDPKQGKLPAKRDPLLWYLNHPVVRRSSSPHPLVDLDRIVEQHPDLDVETTAPLEAWLAQAGPDSVVPGPPGSPAVTLGEVVAWSNDAVRRWRKENALRNAPRITHEMPAEVEVPAAPRSASQDRPAVSVVMPLWNRAAVVRSAIESVQAQTLTGWELIVVDDGSTDDSVAVVTGMAAFDSRIVLVRGEHRGVSAARNTGLAQARGRYAAFLDTDNEWRPQFLQVMVGELDAHPDWAMAHAALRATDGDRVYYRAFAGSHETLLVSNHVDLNVLLVRMDVVREVGGFDESLRRGVDYDLVLRIAADHDLHLVRYIGADYTDDRKPGGERRISTSESLTWLSVIASRHLVDWPAVRTRRRQEGLTSIVLCAPSVRAVARWLREGAQLEGRAETVVVGVILPRWQHVLHTVLTRAYPGSRLVTLQADRGATTTANVGFAATRGDRVVLVLDPVDPDPATAVALADALDPVDGTPQAVAQPLVLGPTGSISAAGAVFDDETVRPQWFLRDHAVSDATRSPRIGVPAAAGPVAAVWGDHLAALGGLDPLCEHLALTDLSLRAWHEGLGSTTLHTGLQLVARYGKPVDDAAVLEAYTQVDGRIDAPPPGSAAAWEAAGFTVDTHRYDVLPGQKVKAASRPLVVPRAVLRPLRHGPTAEVVEPAPLLRWAIDLASPVGEPGRAWGDTHYGEALAQALRRRGQQVAVDARDTRHRSSRDHDDVILVLRGLDRVEPRPGRVNLEWVISHPDLVTAEEVAAFDQVFAASHAWSAQVSADWGVEVTPLLQATDPSLFHPERAEFDTGADVLFVGNSRGIFRTSLRHARAAGIDVTVHGSGWSSMIGADAVASRLVDNRDLGALYTAAGVVLNDHWEDMRLKGFVSNRLMDAAASGARVASDAIPGLDLTALFGGLVQTWDDEHDLARIVRERDSLFPSGEDRVRAAERVAAEHSFDARADLLLDAAARLVRSR